MRTRNQSIKRRLIDGIDWLVDAATLGEYGFEHVDETTEAPVCSEPFADHAPRRRVACERNGSTTTTLFAIS